MSDTGNDDATMLKDGLRRLLMQKLVQHLMDNWQGGDAAGTGNDAADPEPQESQAADHQPMNQLLRLVQTMRRNVRRNVTRLSRRGRRKGSILRGR